MKGQALRVLMILSLVATMVLDSVNAQSLNFTLDVPYSFSVGEKELPAGSYKIHRSPWVWKMSW